MKYLLRYITLALLAVMTMLLSLVGLLEYQPQNEVPHSEPLNKPHSLQPPAERITSSKKTRAGALLEKMPLLFERNQGQFAPDVRFVARGKGYKLALQSSGATLTLAPSSRSGKKSASRILRMTLVGGNKQAAVQGKNELATKINYMIGNDQKNWRTGVSTFDRATLKNVYPGVDAVYYGNGHSLEYDFMIAPGASPHRIQLRFSGTDAMRFNAHGDLILRVGHEEFVQHAPVVYQEINGERVKVTGRYRFYSRNVIGFEIGSYNRTLPLVIDPTLVYSTYVGSDNFGPTGLAVGADGSCYLVGQTKDIGVFALNGKTPKNLVHGSPTDIALICIAKLVPAGNALEYLTYIGGTQQDSTTSSGHGYQVGSCIAVDQAGNAYVGGRASVLDFPTVHAYQSTRNARVRSVDSSNPSSNSQLDAILFKLNPKGDALLYSTYFGGSKTVPLWNYYNDPTYLNGPDNALDSVTSVKVDEVGNAYMTGYTNAIDFPVVNGFQTKIAGGNVTQETTKGPSYDAFVVKINTAAIGSSSLAYSTYLGGFDSRADTRTPHPVGEPIYSSEDIGGGVATDGKGKVYVTGSASNGTDEPFPVKGGLPSTSGLPGFPGFVAEIDTLKQGGASLIASTLLNGSGSGTPYQNVTGGYDVALDDSGGVYVAGATMLSVIAGKTATSFGSSTTQVSRNALIIKLNADLSSVQYATLLCGADTDTATSIAVDGTGQVLVAGETYSADFPQVDPLSGSAPPGPNGKRYDDFLAKLSASGTSAIYITVIGGSGSEYTVASGVGLDGAGNVYMAGATSSTDFPTTSGALQKTAKSGVPNGFVLKIQASGLYVNSTGDSDDSNAANSQYDGECSTGKTLSNGQAECTLRAAIQEANHAKIKPTISFNITVGVAANTIPKISIKKPLPSLDVPMTLDGTSQSGVKRVWLNGVSGGAMSGLVVAGGNSVIKGLLINQIRGDGILVRTKGSNKIENCWIGLSDKGIADTRTGVAGNGVHILNSPGNVVGGASESKRCVIGGNTGDGVWIDGGKSTNNSVQGCFIGTDISGTKAAGNNIGVSVGPEKTQTTILALNAQIGGSSGVPGTGAGNVISANRFGGVTFNSSSGGRVQGNLIGTDKTGTKALGNNIGVNVFGAPGNIIGGSPNVISGNAFGIALLLSGTTGNSVQNNLVGTDIKGDKALPNVTGILLCAASGNDIGSDGRNVVSGNTQIGISLVAKIEYGEPVNGVPQYIQGAANKNTLAQNTIGLDKSGTKALPNAIGLALDKCENTTVSKNVVSGNSAVGVLMQGRCYKTNFSGNLVGTGASGTSAVPNAVYGVLMQEADYNLFDGNTLSGNGIAGLVLGGIFPPGVPAPLKTEQSGPTHNTFTSNFIGTNPGGTSALPNGSAATSGGGAGVLVLPSSSSDPFTGASDNIIGTSGKGNVISGNRGAGVLFVGIDGADKEPRNAANATLQSNFIGTAAGGKTGVPNSGSGVGVVKGSAKIGGSSTLGNTIAFNGGDGVTVTLGSGNTIMGNAIFSNKKLGIDLKGDGVTFNRTTGAPDSKLPNLGQNFPELLKAQVANGKTTVQGILKGAATTQYHIEFFLNGSRDSSGYGEGQKLVGAIEPTADSTGTIKFTTTLSLALSGTQFLSMTATDPKGNTSEFSGLSRAISGQAFKYITDPKNANATIKQGLVNVRIDRLDSKGVVKESTSTDADGFYAFVGVPAGTWTLKPSSKTGSFDTKFDPLSRLATVSTDKPSVSGVDFITYSVYGVVKDVAGKPLASYNVSLVGTGRSVKTGKDGSYRFDGLGKGQYDVEFNDTFSPKFKIVTLPTSGQAGASPNARVDARQGLSISGHVTDAAGKPLADLRVDLVNSTISPVVTDKNGNYEFEGLVVGSYRVAPTASAGKFTPSSRDITLKDKNVTGMNFVRQPSSINSLSSGIS